MKKTHRNELILIIMYLFFSFYCMVFTVAVMINNPELNEVQISNKYFIDFVMMLYTTIYFAFAFAISQMDLSLEIQEDLLRLESAKNELFALERIGNESKNI